MDAETMFRLPVYARPLVRVLHGPRETFGRVLSGVEAGRVWIEIPYGDKWLAEPFALVDVLEAVANPLYALRFPL